MGVITIISYSRFGDINGGRSAREFMVLLTSIIIGLTMYMALEIWKENSGTDWKEFTALPPEKM